MLLHLHVGVFLAAACLVVADRVTGGALCAEGELLKRLRRAPLLGVIGELNTSWADGELGNCKTEKQNNGTVKSLSQIIVCNCIQFKYKFLNYSWTWLNQTRLIQIPRYFELKTIFLGFPLLSFTIRYFELALF